LSHRAKRRKDGYCEHQQPDRPRAHLRLPAQNTLIVRLPTPPAFDRHQNLLSRAFNCQLLISDLISAADEFE
jgi:hypothetical protein